MMLYKTLSVAQIKDYILNEYISSYDAQKTTSEEIMKEVSSLIERDYGKYQALLDPSFFEQA